MRIKQIQLRNIACFNLQSIELAHLPESGLTTIFAGETGAGKTVLLRTMFAGFSWFVARFRDARTAGIILSDEEIRKDSKQSRLGIKVYLPQDSTPHSSPDDQPAAEPTSFQWALYKTRNDLSLNGLSRVELDELMQLIDHYQQQLKSDAKASLPLLVYYPVERQAQDISATAKPPVLSNQLATYDLNPTQNNILNRFFDWFREQEDIENEQRAQAHRRYFATPRAESNSDLDEIYSKLMHAQQQFIGHNLRQVNTAISIVMPELSNLRIQRSPKLCFLIDRDGESTPLSQLSLGSKTLLAMVGDIVRRLCCHNPSSINPIQEGQGIILIDEIELHLSTLQQRHIVERLQQAFPNCQLIISTQSEAVYLGQHQARCYALERGVTTLINTDYQFDTTEPMLEEHLSSTLVQTTLPMVIEPISAIEPTVILESPQTPDPAQLLQPLINLLQNNLSTETTLLQEQTVPITEEDKSSIQELIGLLKSALITDNKELSSALLSSLSPQVEQNAMTSITKHKDGSS